jgi:hypothetical protein
VVEKSEDEDLGEAGVGQVHVRGIGHDERALAVRRA